MWGTVGGLRALGVKQYSHPVKVGEEIPHLYEQLLRSDLSIFLRWPREQFQVHLVADYLYINIGFLPFCLLSLLSCFQE